MADKEEKGLFDVNSNDLRQLAKDLTKIGFKSLDDNILSKCTSRIGRDLLRNLSSAVSETVQGCLVAEAKLLNSTSDNSGQKPASVAIVDKTEEKTATEVANSSPVKAQQEAIFD